MVHIKYKNNSAQTESNVHCPANQQHSSQKSQYHVNSSTADGTITSLTEHFVSARLTETLVVTSARCVRHAQPLETH